MDEAWSLFPRADQQTPRTSRPPQPAWSLDQYTNQLPTMADAQFDSAL